MIDLLPSEFKEKWLATSRDRNWNYENAIKRLETILNEKNPMTFNSRWVEIKDKGLYLYFLRNVRNLTGIDWLKIIKSLPKEQQNKWRIRSKNESKSKFNEAINELQELIKQKKPKIITSGFIGKENPKLLKYFIKNMKDNNGEINWEIVTNRLDENTKKICRFSKRLEQYKPKKEYINEQELNTLIEKHKNKLYTFFEVLDSSDYTSRDFICLDFINLAKKGNILAKEKLLDYLEILTTQWIEKNKNLEAFKTNGDLLRERLEKCIYYYKDDKEKIYFLKYIYTSLLLEAKRLEIPRYISLDNTYEGGKEKKESRMRFYFGEEEY